MYITYLFVLFSENVYWQELKSSEMPEEWMESVCFVLVPHLYALRIDAFIRDVDPHVYMHSF